MIIVSSAQMKLERTKDHIVVMSQCEDDYIDWLDDVKGIVLQCHEDDVDSEAAAIGIGKKLSVPVIVRADHACSLVKNNETITLDPSRGIVFRGVIASEKEMISRICQIDRSKG